MKVNTIVANPSLEQEGAICYLAKSKGLRVCLLPLDPVRDRENYPHINYSGSSVGGNSATIGSSSYKWVTFEEFMKELLDIQPSVKLTSDYTAIIDKETKVVKVGCQNIPFEKVDELYNRIHDVKVG